MIVYRVCKLYPPGYNPIDGVGAFEYGGRWNSKGVYAVYTASSLALARAELARHINLECLPEGFNVYEIEIPDRDISTIEMLPNDWDTDPESLSTQSLGDRLLMDRNILAIKVPSVCDHQSFNLILNPICHQYVQVKVVTNYPFLA